VIATINQCDLEIDHRKAGDHAGAQHGLKAFLDPGDIFLRHRAADDLVLEQEPASRRAQRLDDDLDLRELAGCRRSASCADSRRSPSLLIFSR